ncbi:predicted protein [Plenodomus lingam JN3]|uniref:Predicted protein n=1 Tax=Leptosphaeria maculans (strain JN3 / isolate v23.1.3 / race Av1-4-5-6-7-8) TaxID=985895 RepID=E4ZUL8_LEPMJ|nr:predicted protein [Plenodomus lingam JN3]CBX95097.1 predicted protein [Plenodomus lingam JN3]
MYAYLISVYKAGRFWKKRECSVSVLGATLFLSASMRNGATRKEDKWTAADMGKVGVAMPVSAAPVRRWLVTPGSQAGPATKDAHQWIGSPKSRLTPPRSHHQHQRSRNLGSG